MRPILALPQRSDAVIATGDLVDGGGRDEYGLLRELLAPLTMPAYLVAGNHDDRDELRRAFADHRYLEQWQRFDQYAIKEHPVRLVALDSVVPGEGGGALCGDRLAWLDRTLDLAPEAADCYVLEPPAMQLHWWSGEALVTHTACIGEIPGPYPFHSGGRLID